MTNELTPRTVPCEAAAEDAAETEETCNTLPAYLTRWYDKNVQSWIHHWLCHEHIIGLYETEGVGVIQRFRPFDPHYIQQTVGETVYVYSADKFGDIVGMSGSKYAVEISEVYTEGGEGMLVDPSDLYYVYAMSARL